MQKAHEYYPGCPEAFVVGLARNGDRYAFEDIVRRRQTPIRNLMRRLCRNNELAEDLAQQVFLQVWLKINKLKKVGAFGGWLRRIAINVWIAHGKKKKDVLNEANSTEDEQQILSTVDNPSTAMDLDSALGALVDVVRMCIVLNYQEGLTHAEISEITGLPLGTVKSHIQRGTQKLRQALSDYATSGKLT